MSTAILTQRAYQVGDVLVEGQPTIVEPIAGQIWHPPGTLGNAHAYWKPDYEAGAQFGGLLYGFFSGTFLDRMRRLFRATIVYAPNIEAAKVVWLQLPDEYRQAAARVWHSQTTQQRKHQDYPGQPWADPDVKAFFKWATQIAAPPDEAA